MAEVEESTEAAEPTSFEAQDVNSNNSQVSEKSALCSCLRDASKSPKKQLSARSVSFPENDSQIVTGYLEPVNPWEYAESTNRETVIESYISSCEKHSTRPIQSVIQQLESYDFDELCGGERFDCLELRGVQLGLESCEALEEVLKRLQFHRINLEDTGLDDEAAVALFDMIEYYEAASRLNISSNSGIGVRGWQAASRMLKRTKCLEELECRNSPLSEQVVPILGRALRLGTQLQVLRLEACAMSGRSLVVLVAGLKLNTTLKELYLGENSLCPSDGLQLAGLLKCNTTLQLLDLSNNGLEDNGVHHIAEALCEQSRPAGLGILILWNNKLTPACAPHLAKALRGNNTLEMLNIGQNELGDKFLKDIEEALIDNRSLLRLGIQSTNVTSQGAIVLSNILAKNSVLQRIDVRDNNVEVTGVSALSRALKTNTSITQIDIDDRPKGKVTSPEEYAGLLGRIREACCRNEAGPDELLLRARLSAVAARKISLTCDTLRPTVAQVLRPPSPPPVSHSFLQVGGETKKGGRLRSPAPSPIPSPVASPSPTRTRFQVSRVSEESSPETTSPVFTFGGGGGRSSGGGGGGSNRFRVTRVEAVGGGGGGSSETPPPPLHVPPPAVTICTPPPVQQAAPLSNNTPPPSSNNTPPRSRKLSSWVPMVTPAMETKAASGLEKLLGLFQNPFRAAAAAATGGGGGEGGTPASGGATWPASRSPGSAVGEGGPGVGQHSASLTSLAVIPPTG